MKKYQYKTRLALMDHGGLLNNYEILNLFILQYHKKLTFTIKRLSYSRQLQAQIIHGYAYVWRQSLYIPRNASTSMQPCLAHYLAMPCKCYDRFHYETCISFCDAKRQGRPCTSSRALDGRIRPVHPSSTLRDRIDRPVERGNDASHNLHVARSNATL